MTTPTPEALMDEITDVWSPKDLAFAIKQMQDLLISSNPKRKILSYRIYDGNSIGSIAGGINLDYDGDTVSIALNTESVGEIDKDGDIGVSSSGVTLSTSIGQIEKLGQFLIKAAIIFNEVSP